MRHLFLFGFAFVLVSCSKQEPNPVPMQTQSLPAFFDCVRENKKLLISAHRGGPRPGFPENAMSTFAKTAQGGVAMLEMDVQSSLDGVLFLYHDQQLGRTATGSGIAETKSWSYLTKQTLISPDGKTTLEHIPSLEQALLWGQKNQLVLQIHIKGSAPVDPVIRMVQKTKMENRVVLLPRSLQLAKKIHTRAPNIMLSISVGKSEQIDAFLTSKISPKIVLGWTGLGGINPKTYARLNSLNIEAIAGTLGKLDKQLANTGQTKLYRDYVRSGVSLLATDRIEVVRKAVKADDNLLQTCPLPTVSG